MSRYGRHGRHGDEVTRAEAQAFEEWARSEGLSVAKDSAFGIFYESDDTFAAFEGFRFALRLRREAADTGGLPDASRASAAARPEAGIPGGVS